MRLISGTWWMFPRIFWLKIKFQKTDTRICRLESPDNNNIIIFLSLENRCTFLFANEKTWKRIFNIDSKFSQNCTEKKIVPSKATINWIFNDMGYYLFIACFDWTIGAFQQTIVRVYYILDQIFSNFTEGSCNIFEKMRKV